MLSFIHIKISINNYDSSTESLMIKIVKMFKIHPCLQVKAAVHELAARLSKP